MPGGIATPGRHDAVLRTLAILLLVSSAVVLGANLYFHILGFLGGTAHMSAMVGLFASALALAILRESIRRPFSKLEEAAGFEVHRGLRLARIVVGAYLLIVLLYCLITNDRARGEIVPPRWLVAIPVIPMVIAFNAFSDAMKRLRFLRSERGMTCPSSSPPTPV